MKLYNMVSITHIYIFGSLFSFAAKQMIAQEEIPNPYSSFVKIKYLVQNENFLILNSDLNLFKNVKLNVFFDPNIDCKKTDFLLSKNNVNIFPHVDEDSLLFLENTLEKYNISFFDVMSDLEDAIPDPLVNIPIMLDKVNINATEFIYYIMFDKNYTALADIINNGNLSNENIQESFNSVNKTSIEICTALKPRLVKFLSQVTTADAIMLLRKFYFKNYDVMNYVQSYLPLMKEFYQIGVRISENEVLFYGNELSHSLNNIETFQVLSYDNTVLAEENFTDKFGYKVIKLSTKSSTYIKFTDNYDLKIIKDCVYFYLDKKEIKKYPVRILQNYKYTLGWNNVHPKLFQVGNPIVCNNELYGLAEQYASRSILFSTFYTGSKSLALDITLAKFLILIVKLHFFI